MTSVERKKDQPTWLDMGLADLRKLETTSKGVLPSPEIIDEGENHEHALALLIHYLELEDLDQRTITTVVGEVLILKNKLEHIVAKRQDARERYVKFALATMLTPYEIWKVEYETGVMRLAFIGVFDGKRQMLVVVNTEDGHVLWNFMHCDRSSLNKHRNGELIHRQ
ncbi:MAG: hypothetical protein KGJ07_08890 [Patescibacteria group bacterium]|nr:hypothetical protein [Patescibacteria group bacterium]